MKPGGLAVAVDSSVLVAALLGWHEHHVAAFRVLDAVLAADDDLVLPVHALIETYAVLTRLPAPHRLSPKDAAALLEGSFSGHARLVGFDARQAWGFVHGLEERSVAGGRTYDALILACAQRGGARRILTLNRRHYEGLDPDFEIVVP